MAISYDTATDGGNNGGSGTLTFAHTCTGANGYLHVGFSGDSTGGADDITSVTYNSVAMVLVDKRIDVTLARLVYLYQLAGPTSGTHNVVITCTGSHYLLGGAASYAGASQTGQPDNSKTDLSTLGATSFGSSVTPVADNCWLGMVAEHNNGGNPSGIAAGANTTLRTLDNAFGTWSLLDGNAAISPPAATTLTVTSPQFQAGAKVGLVLASFKPPVSVSGYLLVKN